MKQKVLIVGAGIGGLATALRLAKAGYEVEIVEKNGQAGMKEADGGKMDAAAKYANRWSATDGCRISKIHPPPLPKAPGGVEWLLGFV